MKSDSLRHWNHYKARSEVLRMTIETFSRRIKHLLERSRVVTLESSSSNYLSSILKTMTPALNKSLSSPTPSKRLKASIARWRNADFNTVLKKIPGNKSWLKSNNTIRLSLNRSIPSLFRILICRRTKTMQRACLMRKLSSSNPPYLISKWPKSTVSSSKIRVSKVKPNSLPN